MSRGELAPDEFENSKIQGAGLVSNMGLQDASYPISVMPPSVNMDVDVQVRAIALECVAHLMKSTDAHEVAAEDAQFLGVLSSALKVSGRDNS